MMRLDVGIIKLDQQQIRSDLGQIKDELIRCKSGQENTTSKTREISSDNGLIQEELKLLKLGQQRLESLLNGLVEQQPNRTTIARSCAEAMSTSRRSGIYEILIPSYRVQPFKVACDGEIRGGNWTIILRRMNGSVDFYRKWVDYKEGFGRLTGEFFLGLDKMHALTNDQPHELFILFEDFEGNLRYEAYDAFAIGDELDYYKLHTLGKATGSAGDSLRRHHKMNFSSQDQDNDKHDSNCAKMYTGGWWYNDCHDRYIQTFPFGWKTFANFSFCFSNLMGRYKDNTDGKGVNWRAWHGHEYSLKRAVMMIRPTK